MMKAHIALVIALAFMASCSSAGKMLQKGDYAAAVEKSVRKLQKSPNNEKHLDILAQAYPRANERNLERVEFLQREGESDRWEDLYREYNILKRRQDMVRTVTPKRLGDRIIQFEFVNYDDQIIEAKRKASAFYYANGENQMKMGTKQAYRSAWDSFRKVQQFSSSYPDITQKIDEARMMGSNYVLITMDNSTIYKLPNKFRDDLMAMNIRGLNRDWTEYVADNGAQKLENFDYVAKVNLRVIAMSPEQVRETNFTESRQVQDGFEFEYDARGNVKKDSVGNDIKRPKYKTLTARVIETRQLKTLHMEGTVDFIDLRTNSVIRSRPVAADHIFEHMFRIAQGDLDALSRETRETVGGRPVPFPIDIDMIFATLPPFRQSVYDALQFERNLFK